MEWEYRIAVVIRGYVVNTDGREQPPERLDEFLKRHSEGEWELMSAIPTGNAEGSVVVILTRPKR